MSKATNLDYQVAVNMGQAILGACLMDAMAYDNICQIVDDQTFPTQRMRDIHSAINSLYKRNEPIDMLTVMGELRRVKKLESSGGPAYLSELTNYVAGTKALVSHARILKEDQIRREAQVLGNKILQMTQDPSLDVFDMLDLIEGELVDLSLVTNLSGPMSMEQLGRKKIEEIKFQQKLDPDKIVGLSTGFPVIDRTWLGMREADMICLAGRPGMGKTALALTIAKNVADSGAPVGFFSLEMPALQLYNRILSQEAEVSGRKIMDIRQVDSDAEFQLVATTIDRLDAAPIYIDDTGGLTPYQLKSKARRLRIMHKVELIIVDYLQLMSGDDGHRSKGGNREQEVSAISRSIKALAKELGIPIMALSQLSRASVMKTDKRPELQHLRESGSIEQDCDLVVFVHRPEYYDILEDKYGNSTKGIAEIITAKNRRGELATDFIRFDGELTKFTNIGGSAPAGAISSKPAKVEDDDLPF